MVSLRKGKGVWVKTLFVVIDPVSEMISKIQMRLLGNKLGRSL